MNIYRFQAGQVSRPGSVGREMIRAVHFDAR